MCSQTVSKLNNVCVIACICGWHKAHGWAGQAFGVFCVCVSSGVFYVPILIMPLNKQAHCLGVGDRHFALGGLRLSVCWGQDMDGV